MDLNLMNIALASSGTSVSVAATESGASEKEGTLLSTQTAVEEKSEAEHAGITLDPAIIGFQALNFLVLLLILKWILYKPLLKIMKDRQEKIQQGIENAENAEILLKESTDSRQKMLKETRAESQIMIEHARQSGEQVRTGILSKAQEEAQHIIAAGKQSLDSEKAKALQDIRIQAVDMVLTATEKLLREKMTAGKDDELIKKSLESFVK